MSDIMHDPRLLLLDPRDNVFVALETLAPGQIVTIEGRPIMVPRQLSLGHKIAARAIRAGEKIVKYGAPIGSATCDIAAGEHVHLHNMRSDYLPTYTLEAGRTFAEHHDHH